MVQLYPPYQREDDTDDSDSEWSSDQEEEEYDELLRMRREEREDRCSDLLLEPPEQFADCYNITDNDCAFRNHIDLNHCSATDCECGKSAGISFERFNDYINDFSRIVNLQLFIFKNIVTIKLHELFDLLEKSYSTAKSNNEESHHQRVNSGKTGRLNVRENDNLCETVSEFELVVKNDNEKELINSSCSYRSNCSVMPKEVTEEIIIKKVALKGLSATPFNYIQTPEEDPKDVYDYVFAERSSTRGWTNTENQSLVDDWKVCNIPQKNVLDANQQNVSEEATNSTRER